MRKRKRKGEGSGLDITITMIAGDEKKRERVRGVRFAACKCHESFRRQLTPSESCSRNGSDSGGGANCPRCLKRWSTVGQVKEERRKKRKRGNNYKEGIMDSGGI